MKENVIQIESFNPYEDIYPGRKLVKRDLLILIKNLRAEGYEVIVLPKNNQPFEYLEQKGVTEFLSDPVNSLIITFLGSIAGTLFTNWIQKLIDGKKGSKNIFLINNTTNIITNSFNQTVAKSKLEDVKQKRKKLIKSFSKCLKTKSPYPYLTWPILKNHKPEIIGWCRLEETDIGLEMIEGILVDENFKRKMKNGIYKGFSFTSIAVESSCSICNNSYVHCNHIAGNYYDKKHCLNIIKQADLIEVSIVKEPVNKNALLNLKI